MENQVHGGPTGQGGGTDSSRRRVLSGVRRIVTACGSCGIVLAASMYLVAPSQLAWSVNVDKHRSGPRVGEVLYGRATDLDGHGLRNVRILVSRNVRSSPLAPGAPTADRSTQTYAIEVALASWLQRVRSQPLAILVSSPDGTYRCHLSQVSGQYLLTVMAASGGGGVTTQATARITLDPGNTYRIDVHESRFGTFFFLPFPA